MNQIQETKNKFILHNEILRKINTIDALTQETRKEDVAATFYNCFHLCDNGILDVLNGSNAFLISNIGKRLRITIPNQLNLIDNYLNNFYCSDTNAEVNLKQIGKELDSFINTFLLLFILIKLRKQEASWDYQSTTHHQLTTLIFESIKRNRNTNDIYKLVMQEVATFLEGLSIQEKGNLAIEHYIIDYNRNQTVYFQCMKYLADPYRIIENAVYYTVFKGILFTLGERLKEEKNQQKMLEAICATEFYKENFSEKEKQFRKE